MARFIKFKFQTILKLNFNGGQFYKKIKNFGYYTKLLILHLNQDWKRKCWLFALKFWVKNFESKSLSEFKLNTKPIMARFLKFKFQTILKLNFNGGQFYKKI